MYPTHWQLINPQKQEHKQPLKSLCILCLASAWDSLRVSSVSLPRRSVGLRGLGHPGRLQSLQAFRDLLGRWQKPLFRCLALQKKKTQTLTQLRVRFRVLQVHRALRSGMLSLDVSGHIPASWTARAMSVSFPLQGTLLLLFSMFSLSLKAQVCPAARSVFSRVTTMSEHAAQCGSCISRPWAL